MFYAAVFFALPVLAAASYLYVTGLERATGLTYGVPLALALLGAGTVEGGRRLGLMDTEIWNGRITQKTHGSMGCCHCRNECDTCTRTDDKGRTETYACRCHEVCDHTVDYRWDLRVSTGDTVPVKTCEASSSLEPVAWTKAYVGEPASVEHPYTNYLLADPASVYRQSAAHEVSLPTTMYPRVSGLYRVDHVVGTWPVSARTALETAMDELDADLGAKKQVNVLLYGVTGSASATEAAQALTLAWLYGKKNDLIVVVQHDNATVQSADLVTISRVGELRSHLQADLPGLALPELPDTVRGLVATHFTRTPMAEWAYLEGQAEPPIWALVVASLLLVGGGVVYVVQDAFRSKDFFSRLSWSKPRF